jgi:hypothetical protein
MLTYEYYFVIKLKFLNKDMSIFRIILKYEHFRYITAKK